MEHIYKGHTLRKTTVLNGEWKFCVDRQNVGETEKWYQSFPTDYRFINVPGCWNIELDLFEYFGTAWYQTEFECTEDEYIQVEFGAVTGLAKVYIDGEFAGEHYGGWLAFKFGKMLSAGVHTLTVSVDASSNAINTIPLQRVDWFHYGGITRTVQVNHYKAPFINSHCITYTLNDKLDTAVIKAQADIYNPFSAPLETELSVFIENNKVGSAKAVINDKGTLCVEDITVNNIRLWDIGKGELYEVRLAIDNDDIIERIGFRKLETKNMEILLNGKPVTVCGINRHEEHPDWGFAVPAGIMKRDLQIIKDLNCNFVRGSHYPDSHTFVDYLDREGILFWSEIPMWGYKAEALADELTIRRGLTMHTEMVNEYRHHASIVAWGLHNECATETQEGYNITKKFAECVRSLDDSRLITYATNRFDTDISLEFVDVVSINYYFGWYGGTLERWDTFIPELRAKMVEKGIGDKPIIVSEFGCAAIAGYSSFRGNKWTMQYQSKFVETVIRLSNKEPGVSGTLVWQFCDISSDMEIGRARSFNNKGIIDEYRRPKMSYYTVKELYKEILNK